MIWVLVSFIILFSFFPIQKGIEGVRQKSKTLSLRLDQPKQLTWAAQGNMVMGWILFLSFGKGLLLGLLLWVESDLDPLIGSVLIIGVVMLHIWPPFNRFKPQRYWTPLFIGLFTGLTWWLGLAYLALLLCFSWILDSIIYGQIISLFGLIIIIGISSVSLYYLSVSFGVFVILLIAIRHPLFEHLDDNRWTLTQSFESRLS